MVDRNARVVDRLVHDARGIGLRRPAEVVDSLRPVALPARVDLVDRDDLARLGLGQQLLVVEAPPRGRVAPEALALVLRVRARPRLHVDDPDLEDIPRLRLLHRDGPGADVHPQALARAPAEQRRVHRAGAASVHALALLVPVEDALRPRIALHHPLGVVVGVVGQHLDGDEIARAHLDLGLQQLAEVPPVDGLVGGGNVVVVLGARHHARLRLGRRHRGEAGGRERRRGTSRHHGALEELPPPFALQIASRVALAFTRGTHVSSLSCSGRCGGIATASSLACRARGQVCVPRGRGTRRENSRAVGVTQGSRAQGPVMRSCPSMYGRSTSGMVTVPSAFW
jgi:hypothetical protein